MKLSATFRIVISLASMTVSILLVWGTLGLLPNTTEAILDGRLKFCDTLALSFTAMATQNDVAAMEHYFKTVAQRHEDVLALTLRRNDGTTLIHVGRNRSEEASSSAQSTADASPDAIQPVQSSGRKQSSPAPVPSQRGSTTRLEEEGSRVEGKEHGLPESDSSSQSFTTLRIPIITGDTQWGELQVDFADSLDGNWLHRYLTADMIFATSFGSAMFLVFYVYLSRVLRQLNPSRVIPSRVREAFDSLAEGIVVLDASRNIVLANRAFSQFAEPTNAELLGKCIDRIPFVRREEAAGKELPWIEVSQNMQSVRGVLLGIEDRTGTFSVSAAPILSEQGDRRGILVSFEDVTQLEKKKNELGSLVTHLHRSSQEIRRQNAKLEHLANHDALTSCRNRRSFFDRFEAEWLTSQRYKMPISAIMVDVDHFKSINDTFGHSVGDDVLRLVASALQETIRDCDILCRYGGEEFAVALPNTNMDQAMQAAERLRLAIEKLRLPDMKITASLGVSTNTESTNDPQDILDQADQCLYVAKRNGRNQSVRWDMVAANSIGDLTSDEPKKLADDHSPKRAQRAGSGERKVIPYHSVSALLSALAYRDHKTAAHCRRVADYCVAVAEGLLSISDTYMLEMAALLHDIGKVRVPDAILLKPTQLTDAEWEVMRSHTCMGANIVHAAFAAPKLTELVRGYQRHVSDPAASDAAGACILPVGARILAIADAYDAMTTDKSYRDAMGHVEAEAELRKHSGTQFDPELVERFLDIVQDVARPHPAVNDTKSADVARSIGEQIESLVSVLDSQDLLDMSALAVRLRQTASSMDAPEISQKAHELEVALENGEDFIGAMQSATELLDLCRATQVALLGGAEKRIATAT